MCFNRRATAVAAALSALLLTTSLSCGLRTGEAPAPPLSPSFKGDSYGCVGEIPEKLDAYFADRLGDVGIKTFFTCMQKAFVTFSQLTRGRDEGIYSPDELRMFLQQNFLRDKYQISDVLMNEFMLIKQALVGGAYDRVTRAELYGIVELLDELKTEAIRLRPHLRLINPRLNGQDDPQDLANRLTRAGEAMEQTVRTFATRLERSQVDYSLEHLRVFLREFRHFTKWDEHFRDAVPVDAWIDMIKAFKVATVAPLDPELIHPSEWMPLLRSMWRWYSVFVHYQFGVKGQVVIEDVGLQNLILLADEVFDLSREGIRRQPDLLLSFDTVMNVFEAAKRLRWVSPNIEIKSVRRAVQALTTRVFGDPRTPPSDRRTTGFTMDALASMSADFYRWARIQSDLNQVYGRVNKTPRTPSLQAHNYINPEIRQQLAGPRGSEWADFMHVNSLIDPLFPESPDGSPVRVVLAPAKTRAKMGMINGFTNLSYMNLLRTIVTLVYRGYAEAGQGRSAWSTGIQIEELELFYSEYRDLLVNLKIADWRNCGAGARSFIEGNLFTYTSDGVPFGGDGGKLDVREAMQLFAYLYSGGTLAQDFYAHFDRVCEKGPVDINNLPKVSRECVRRELPKLIAGLDNLPGLRDFLRESPAVISQRYVETLLDAVFTTKNLLEDPAKSWVEMNELSSMSVVMHYAESMMTRFDKDVNGTLSSDELHAAIPVFEGFIRKFMKDNMNITKLNTPEMARGAFMFIAREGRLPESWADKGRVAAMGYGVWSVGETSDISLDRLGLARTFGAIINKLLEEGPEVDVRTRQCLPKRERAG